MVITEDHRIRCPDMRPETAERPDAADFGTKIIGISAGGAQLYRGVCANDSSLGKTWPGVGVGVGTTVLLEPPPQPIAAIRIMAPNKMPVILAMAINLFSKKLGDAGGESVYENFTPITGRLTRVAARP